MLVLSKVLVEIVKQYDPSKTKKVCLCASHGENYRGAVLQTDNNYGFICEEDLFKVVVREATDELNRQGWDVDQAGIDEHEQHLGFDYYSSYDLVLSNHFNSAGAPKLTMYNPPTKGVAEQINNIRNGLTAQYGIAAASLVVGYYRGGPDMLYMVQAGKAGVLLEWFGAHDNYDVNQLLSQVGNTPTPQPTPETQPEQPKLQWFEHCAPGTKWGNETIIDAYNEIGGESWYVFNNVPHALSIYPGVYEAMRGVNPYDGVEIVNGNEVKYYGVVLTDKHNYIVYTRNNGLQGVISIKNKETGQSYGYVK